MPKTSDKNNKNAKSTKNSEAPRRSDTDTTPLRKKPRFSPDTHAKRALKRELKRSCELVIPRAIFKRCAVETRKKFQRSEMRYERDAVTALQHAAEAFIVQWFQAGDAVRRCSGTARSVPKLLLPRHMHAVNAVGRVMAPQIGAFWPASTALERAPPRLRITEPESQATPPKAAAPKAPKTPKNPVSTVPQQTAKPKQAAKPTKPKQPKQQTSKSPAKIVSMPPPLLQQDARQRAEQERYKQGRQGSRQEQRTKDSDTAQSQLRDFQDQIRDLVGLSSPGRFY